jgi:tetratricopeptide (TPR) repeat protein
MYRVIVMLICLAFVQVPIAAASDCELAEGYEQKAREAGEDYQVKALFFRRAIKACPESSDAYAELSLALLEMKNLEEAESVIKRGVEVDPDNSKIRRVYGDVLRAKKEFGLAVRQYEKALTYAKIPRHRFYALAHLGWAQHGLNNHTESTNAWVGALDIGLNFDPFTSRQLYNMVAWNYAVCRTNEICDGKLAVKFYNEIPKNNRTWYELGTGEAAYARMRDFDTAVRLQEESIALIESTDMPDKEGWLSGARERMALYKNARWYSMEQ